MKTKTEKITEELFMTRKIAKIWLVFLLILQVSTLSSADIDVDRKVVKIIKKTCAYNGINVGDVEIVGDKKKRVEIVFKIKDLKPGHFSEIKKIHRSTKLNEMSLQASIIFLGFFSTCLPAIEIANAKIGAKIKTATGVFEDENEKIIGKIITKVRKKGSDDIKAIRKATFNICPVLELSDKGKEWNAASTREKKVLAHQVSGLKGRTSTFWLNTLNEYYAQLPQDEYKLIRNDTIEEKEQGVRSQLSTKALTIDVTKV